MNSDMYGSVTFITQRNEIIQQMFDRIAAQVGCNPDDSFENTARGTMAIACEFAGQNIQKNVAVSSAPKFLAIYGVRVNDRWLSQDEWAALKLESHDHRIFNVRDARLPQYSFTLNMDDYGNTQNTLATLVDEIDKKCPFGSNILGVEGVGEGLVLHAKGYESDTQMYFKVKGDSHSESKVKTLRPMSQETIDNFKTLRGFVNAVVTPQRLEQGYDILLEQGLQATKPNVGVYTRWILDDIVKESRIDIEERHLNLKAVLKEAGKVASAHYLQRIKSDKKSVD